MQYIITEQTINKIISLIADKPFKDVISLLNEIKIVLNNEDEILINNVNNDLGGQNANVN